MIYAASIVSTRAGLAAKINVSSLASFTYDRILKAYEVKLEFD